MSRAYADLTNRQQIEFLRRYAREFAAEFRLDSNSIRLVQHAFNTTFLVDDPIHGPHALRINTNSFRQIPEMIAETTFVSQIGGNPNLDVAIPRTTQSGEMVIRRDWPGQDRHLAAVCYSWLSGRFVDKKPTVRHAELVGKATAALHDFAETWQMPPGGKFKIQNDILQAEPWRLADSDAIKDHGIWTEVTARAEDAYQQLRKEKPIPIHFDLHFHNMKFLGNKIQVFDFDDMILDRPIVDAAVTFFYWRFSPISRELEETYWRHNPRNPESVGLSQERFEALIAGRLLFLVSGLAAINTANLKDLGKAYIRAGEVRLAHYLRTGRYDPTVAKVR